MINMLHQLVFKLRFELGFCMLEFGFYLSKGFGPVLSEIPESIERGSEIHEPIGFVD
jgi:hypothetical protein